MGIVPEAGSAVTVNPASFRSRASYTAPKRVYGESGTGAGTSDNASSVHSRENRAFVATTPRFVCICRLERTRQRVQASYDQRIREAYRQKKPHDEIESLRHSAMLEAQAIDERNGSARHSAPC
jgi:hypothetical protein